MKTNSTRIYICGLLLFILTFCSLLAFAQPDFRFQGSQLMSGTARQPGAVYRFNNVKPGVDAYVTIVSLSPGITCSDLDGGSGYSEALQPTLEVSPYTNGYLELRIQFFVAGTLIPYIAPTLFTTCIDVDGMRNNDGYNRPLYEFDEINVGGGFVDFDGTGGELVISRTGNWWRGKNISGVDYPQRDTAARSAMFTVANVLVTSFTIRVGADNRSSIASTRLRSVYFKRFIYLNMPLRLPRVLEFEGVNRNNEIKLEWKIELGSVWDQCVLERATEDGKFKPIAVFLATHEIATNFNYTDRLSTRGQNRYRLKLRNAGGDSSYSKTLFFSTVDPDTKPLLWVYPTLVNNQFTVAYEAERNESAQLQVVDHSGRVVLAKPVQLQQGANNIIVNEMAGRKGNYIVALRKGGQVLSQKIIVQ